MEPGFRSVMEIELDNRGGLGEAIWRGIETSSGRRYVFNPPVTVPAGVLLLVKLYGTGRVEKIRVIKRPGEVKATSRAKKGCKII
jgi:hypothetical protein